MSCLSLASRHHQSEESEINSSLCVQAPGVRHSRSEGAGTRSGTFKRSVWTDHCAHLDLRDEGHSYCSLFPTSSIEPPSGLPQLTGCPATTSPVSHPSYAVSSPTSPPSLMRTPSSRCVYSRVILVEWHLNRVICVRGCPLRVSLRHQWNEVVQCRLELNDPVRKRAPAQRPLQQRQPLLCLYRTDEPVDPPSARTLDLHTRLRTLVAEGPVRICLVTTSLDIRHNHLFPSLHHAPRMLCLLIIISLRIQILLLAVSSPSSLAAALREESLSWDAVWPTPTLLQLLQRKPVPPLDHLVQEKVVSFDFHLTDYCAVFSCPDIRLFSS